MIAQVNKVVALAAALAFFCSCGRYLTEKEKVEVLRNRGFRHFIKNEFEESADDYITALTLSQLDRERLFNDRALYNYGLLFTTWDRYNALLERLEKRLVKARKERNRKAEINILLNLGEVYYELQRYRVAWDLFQEAFQKAEKHNYLQGFCRSANNLGKTLVAQSRPDNGLKYFYLAGKVAGRFKEDESLVDSFIGIGSVWAAKKDFAKARENYTIALEDSQRLDYSEGREAALESLGRLSLKQKDYRQALSSFIPALSAKIEMVDQKGGASLWELTGDAYFAWGRFLKAQNAYAQAFRIRFDIKTFYQCCLLLRKLGRVYRAMGNQPAALYYYGRSRLFFKTMGDLTGESETRLEIARYYYSLGKIREAEKIALKCLKVVINIENELLERETRAFLAGLHPDGH
ncbi:MAG: tetratricopeptide repeat protein [bacterium]